MIDASPLDWGDETLGLPLVSIRPVTSSGNTILNFSELGMVSLELGTTGHFGHQNEQSGALFAVPSLYLQIFS